MGFDGGLIELKYGKVNDDVIYLKNFQGKRNFNSRSSSACFENMCELV